MQRAKYLDIAKGLGILCIVLLHFEDGLIPGALNVFIGLFMISVFYVTSGWLDSMRDKTTSLKDLIAKRWQQLGKPYVYWTIIILIFDSILCLLGHYDTKYIGGEIYKSVVLRGIGTLWFLPALFGGEIMWNFTKNKKIALSVVLLALILAFHYVASKYFEPREDTMGKIIYAPIRTLVNMTSAWIGIAFGYAAHRCYRKHEDSLDRIKLLAAGIIFCAISYVFGIYCEVGCITELTAPLFGPLGFIFIFKAIEDKIPFRYLNYWGIHSLGLMVTHYSFFLVICWIIQNHIDGTEGELLHGWPSIGYFVATMILEYFVVEMIEKKFPFLLGKK